MDLSLYCTLQTNSGFSENNFIAMANSIDGLSRLDISDMTNGSINLNTKLMTFKDFPSMSSCKTCYTVS